MNTEKLMQHTGRLVNLFTIVAVIAWFASVGHYLFGSRQVAEDMIIVSAIFVVGEIIALILDGIVSNRWVREENAKNGY
jgi:hypothetical protein